MANEFCLKMPDFHVTFRDLLHAVNLRYGKNGFTSLLKEGVLRIFSPWKIRRLRPGSNPRTWVPKTNRLTLDHRNRFWRVRSSHSKIMNSQLYHYGNCKVVNFLIPFCGLLLWINQTINVKLLLAGEACMIKDSRGTSCVATHILCPVH